MIKRIIVSETDRIGDVILSLPVFKSLKKWDKSIYTAALISPYTKELFKNFKYVDDIIEYTNYDKNTFHNMRIQIKAGNFDTALILHPDYKVVKLIKKSEIPRIISYGWKWYQFLYTDTVIQHRSKNEKHQIEYNIDLLKALGVDTIDTNVKLSPDIGDLKFIKNLLKEKKLNNKKLIGIHPGSGKSSNNLPVEKYAKLISLLKNKFPKYEIVITHSSKDKAIIQKLITLSSKKIYLMPENLTLGNLIALISQMKLFISNSTGPLHIASALRIPTIGFYSPVFVHSPVRWGPYWGKRLIIKPPVDCPEKWHCKYDKCKYYNCFDKIEFKELIEFINKLKY